MTQLKKFPLVSLMALGFAMPALAQVPADRAAKPATASGPQAAEEKKGVDVILVTANKREESIEDVAVAITAISSADRDKIGIQTMQDLTNITPGLSYTQGNERVFLRGVGRNTNNFGAEPGVANYTDGIYESFATIAGREPIFVDRIEVLRGPQGTLYGRNSIGGLLNVVSKRPTDDFEAEFRTGFGNFDERKIQASVSGAIPFLPGVRGRLVGAKEVRDKGFFFNYGTNESEGGNIDSYTVEAQLEGDITDRWSWWVKADTGGYHMAGPPGGRTNVGEQSPFDPTFAPPGGIGVNPGFAYSGNASLISFTQGGTFIGNPAATDLRKLNDNVRGQANLDGYNDYAVESIYKTDLFDIKYTGGYVYYDYNLYGDFGGTPVKSITYDAITSNLSAGPCTGVPNLVGFPTSTLAGPAAGCITGRAAKTIFPDGYSRYHENRAFFSNEINLISTYDSPLQWIAGLYAYQENFKQPIETFLPNEPNGALLVEPLPTPPGGVAVLSNPLHRLTYTNNIGNNNSYGAYGQIDWQFLPTLKFTGGLRWSEDQKHITEEAALNCFIVCATGTTLFTDITTSVWNGKALAGSPAVEVGQKGVESATPTNLSGVTHNYTTGVSSRVLGDTWSAITGTAGLEWTPTRDALVYAKYSRGYKAGGFNATSMSPRPETDPESLNDYEGGWKHQWRELGLTTNLAAFYYDYQKVQTPLTVVPATGPAFTAFVNIPKVETKGVELETTYSPIDNLNILFTYAYLDAVVKKSDIYVNGITNLPQSVKGNVLPQSPKNKIAINANYTWTLTDGSSYIPSVSWYWRDKFTTSIFNDPRSFSPDFDQTDARLTWNSGGGHFTLIGFVRNAFDQEGYDGVSAALRRSSGVVYTSTTLTPPRLYGVEFQFHYK